MFHSSSKYLIVVAFLVNFDAHSIESTPNEQRCSASTIPKEPHGFFETGDNTHFDVGAKVQLECDLGYQSHGSVVRCGEAGKWSKILGGNCYKEYMPTGYGEVTRLHLAAAEGNLQQVKGFAQMGDDLWEKTDSESGGVGAIHYASSLGNLELVKYLISKESDIYLDRTISNGNLPLLFAAMGGHMEVVKYFITDLGMDVSAVSTKHGRTALHCASERGHLKMVKWLINNGADISAASNDYDYQMPAIHFAAMFGQLQVVKYYIQEVDYNMAYWKNSNGEIPMHSAAGGNSLSTVSYFVTKRGVDIDIRSDKDGYTVLHLACLHGHLELVKWLIKKGASTSSKSFDVEMNPIHLAAINGHLPVVKYLIEEVDSRMTYWKQFEGLIPLHFAAAAGSLPVVSYFIDERDMDIDIADEPLGRTALHYASGRGQLEVVKFLVERGADVTATSSSNDLQYTPIDMAASRGHLLVVKFFIEEVDADMAYWSFNNIGDIALHKAALAGKLSVVKYFIDNGIVDIETTDRKFGRTALHKAGNLGYLDVVEFLVSRGANVNATSNEDDSRLTAIHLAAYTGKISVVKYFVENFPHLLNVKDAKAGTPLTLAQLGTTPNAAEVVEYLKLRMEFSSRPHNNVGIDKSEL